MDNLKKMGQTNFKMPKVFNAAGFQKVNEGISMIKTKLGDFGNVDKINQIMIIIIGFIFFIIFFWCYSKMGLDQKNCDTLDELYNEKSLIRSINPSNPIYIRLYVGLL